MNKILIKFVIIIYACLFKVDENGRYSCRFLINKTDSDSINAVTAGIEACFEKNQNLWRSDDGIELSISDVSPLHDGDQYVHDSELYRARYYIDARNRQQPAVFGADDSELNDETIISFGTPAEAVISFAPYNYKGKRGIACRLLGVRLKETPKPCTIDDFTQTSLNDFLDEPLI